LTVARPASEIGVLRLIGLGISLIYGWGLITYFRTSGSNNDILMCLLIALLYVLPVSLLPLMGLRFRTILRCSLLVVAIALASALAWVSVEQFVIAHTATSTEQPVQHWWPFGSRVTASSIDRPLMLDW
jgi:hypothetical protein